MTIAKPRARQAADSFVSAAPDAHTARWQRGSKTQVTLSIAPELLAQIDGIAHEEHLSRAALMTVIFNDWLKRRVS
jgi:hypothetical protein